MDPSLPLVTLGLDAMRTRFEVVLAGEAEERLLDVGHEALGEIERAESLLSLFRRDSLLSHINRTALLEPVRVDRDTMDLLAACREVWRASGGAFDPTVAPLMSGFKLHEGAMVPEMLSGSLDAHGTFGFDAVALEEVAATVRFTRPVALDLGGIAKGHALDLAARVVAESGIGVALLHGGTSSVLGMGRPPGRDGWDVRIRNPIGTCGHSPVVRLDGCALGVSAHHGRRAGGDAGQVGHVLDPRTGRPAQVRCALAAVTAPTAALADAWSTAALVLGARPEGLPVGFACMIM